MFFIVRLRTKQHSDPPSLLDDCGRPAGVTARGLVKCTWQQQQHSVGVCLSPRGLVSTAEGRRRDAEEETRKLHCCRHGPALWVAEVHLVRFHSPGSGEEWQGVQVSAQGEWRVFYLEDNDFKTHPLSSSTASFPTSLLTPSRGFAQRKIEIFEILIKLKCQKWVCCSVCVIFDSVFEEIRCIKSWYHPQYFLCETSF